MKPASLSIFARPRTKLATRVHRERIGDKSEVTAFYRAQDEPQWVGFPQFHTGECL